MTCAACYTGFLLCILLAIIFQPRTKRQGTEAVKDARQRCTEAVKEARQRGTEAPSISSDEQVGVGDYYVEMNVSAYCICTKCCGKWSDGITASGKPAKGLIIAAPPEYAFGTIMEVPGYGRAVVEDRGGAIKGNKIDLLFPTHQSALNWGRQYLTVEIWK